MASTDPKFPASEWYRLIPQSIFTLNILINSRVNPKLSAHVYLHSNFEFSDKPLTTPGTRVLGHSEYATQKTWACHGEDGCYIEPSLVRYHCVKWYLPSANAIRDFDTVKFFPTQIYFPYITPDYYLNHSAKDILSIL